MGSQVASGVNMNVAAADADAVGVPRDSGDARFDGVALGAVQEPPPKSEPARASTRPLARRTAELRPAGTISTPKPLESKLLKLLGDLGRAVQVRAGVPILHGLSHANHMGNRLRLLHLVIGNRSENLEAARERRADVDVVPTCCRTSFSSLCELEFRASMAAVKVRLRAQQYHDQKQPGPDSFPRFSALA